ncbi:hypothetical protein H0H92_002630 [Tricholoma furcatifolium]|nr:hypothetical protein H0H92_002630 [Tricholoma furcatifolium]
MSSLPASASVQPEHQEVDTLHHQPALGSRSNVEVSSAEPDEQAEYEEGRPAVPLSVPLPEIPSPTLDLELDLSSILGTPSNAEVTKIQKRASNIMKLSEENDKLKAELKAMAERLERAERRREELAKRQQMIMEAPSS